MRECKAISIPIINENDHSGKAHGLKDKVKNLYDYTMYQLLKYIIIIE